MIENALVDALALPSLTVMRMPEYTTFAKEVAGVPVNAPVEVLKLAQDGLFSIENVSASPSASAAVGVKLYGWPTTTELGGVPLIVGTRLAGPSGVTVAAYVSAWQRYVVAVVALVGICAWQLAQTWSCVAPVMVATVVESRIRVRRHSPLTAAGASAGMLATVAATIAMM